MIPTNHVMIVKSATNGPAYDVPNSPPTAMPIPPSAAAYSPSTIVPTTGRRDLAAGDRRADADADHRP